MHKTEHNIIQHSRVGRAVTADCAFFEPRGDYVSERELPASASYVFSAFLLS